MTMSDRYYIGLVHKDPDSIYGISFPDVLGVIAAEETIEAVMREGAVALAFAFEDWEGSLPVPRTIEELRRDPEFLDWSKDAIIVAVQPAKSVAAAAE
jgi:predicted RNase H-like HicB family nuclease